jgi:hypothetical protein
MKLRKRFDMSNDQPAAATIPIACHPDAIPAEKQAEWTAVGKAVYAAVEEVAEVEHGYRFRLPNDGAMLTQVATYIRYERLCCAFLHFTVDVSPGRGPLWLALTGGQGVKEYIGSVFATENLISEAAVRSVRFE